MTHNIVLQNIGRFVLLMLLQILVLNHIYLGGYITPFLYVLFVLMLPAGMNRMGLLVVAFFAGLCLDIFCNMMGIHACCCTAVALCRIAFGDRILTGGEEMTIDSPDLRSVGFQTFAPYLFLMLLIYHLLYFFVVIFSFRDIVRILLCSLFSTGVTWVLALLFLSFMPRSKEHQHSGKYG